LAAARCPKQSADHFTRNRVIEGLTVIEKLTVFFFFGYSIATRDAHPVRK
jgi:hypothetical protein